MQHPVQEIFSERQSSYTPRSSWWLFDNFEPTWTQFHQLYARIFRKFFFAKAKTYLEKANDVRAKNSCKKFVRKNVDEIDTLTQFHQHFKSNV